LDVVRKLVLGYLPPHDTPVGKKVLAGAPR